MRLKKGDEVRSHRDCPFGGFKTGDIFTITAVDGDLIMFVDNDGNSRLRPDDEFELLPVADATGKPAFKVGDRVVALKDSAYSIKKGSISTVIRVDGDHIRIRKENGKADGWLAEYFALAPSPSRPANSIVPAMDAKLGRQWEMGVLNGFLLARSSFTAPMASTCSTVANP
ncbi:hypothetical protein HED49_13170 [Ochrobactrum daejeonense]|nr:hypothetical protein [Brucella daejeonensis]